MASVTKELEPQMIADLHRWEGVGLEVMIDWHWGVAQKDCLNPLRLLPHGVQQLLW
ncbi:MAG: hypothetical protein U0892_21850 [Pirellulales bacterium]